MQNNRLDVMKLQKKDHLPPPHVNEKRYDSPFASVLIQTFQSGDYLFISIHGLRAHICPSPSEGRSGKPLLFFG